MMVTVGVGLGLMMVTVGEGAMVTVEVTGRTVLVTVVVTGGEGGNTEGGGLGGFLIP